MDVPISLGSPLRASIVSFMTSRVRSLRDEPLHTSKPLLGTWTMWAVVVVVLLLPYVLSTAQFHRLLRNNKGPNGSLLVPVVPFWIPGLFHTVSIMLDYAGLFSRLITKFGSDKPLLVKAASLRFYVFANPEHIKSVFRNSKHVSNKFFTLFALRRVFGIPADVMPFFEADDSGPSLKPRRGAVLTDPARRINFFMTHDTKTHMSGRHLEAFNAKYMEVLDRNLAAMSDDDGWVAHADLFGFVQMASMAASIESLAGRALLDLYPNFTDDMSYFLSRVPDFFGLCPRWLMPKAMACRSRLLDGIERWHRHAHENSDCRRTGPEDPEWEPFLGSKLVRVRQQYRLTLPEMRADVLATMELGLFFGLSGNSVPAIFWCIFEALRSPGLRVRLMAEIEPCRVGGGDGLDATRVIRQPLLSSVYAEVLRLYVASMVQRVAEYGPVTVAGGYEIPKDSRIVMYSRPLSLDAARWTAAGRPPTVSLDHFDPDRFLVDADWVAPGQPPVKAPVGAAAEEKRFSTDGLSNLWIPYGGGESICPGRHLAKQQIMLTVATLLTRFDFELDLPHPARIGPNMKHAAIGSMPPAAKVPFRMRRRRQAAA